MVSALDVLLSERFIDVPKGLPDAALGIRLREIGEQQWQLFGDDIPFPVAVIHREILNRNLNRFHTYIEQAGAQLAPHGKTTMCPQLFERQLDAGAWGITVATYAQARVAITYGVKSLIIANQLVAPAEIAGISSRLDIDENLNVLSLVDSVATVDRLETALVQRGARRRFAVLVELGFPQGRTGARTVGDALEVARRVAASHHLSLAGIEAYEGLIVSASPSDDALGVSAFLDRLVDLYVACHAERLFAVAQPIVSAGGSAYFDLVAQDMARLLPDAIPLLRSGCYLTHDNGFYAKLLTFAQQRSVLGAAPELEAALEIWGQVVSRPEPDLAIINVGRRDVSDDSGLPRISRWQRRGNTGDPIPVEGWQLFRINDQHGYVRVPPDCPLEPGDLVGMGISHPCTTFDRWPYLLEVDEHLSVVGALRTFF